VQLRAIPEAQRWTVQAFSPELPRKVCLVGVAELGGQRRERRWLCRPQLLASFVQSIALADPLGTNADEASEAPLQRAQLDAECFGWALDEHMRADLPQRALIRALQSRSPQPGLIHHSDRGSQYAASCYRQVLAKWGLAQSMSGAGNCYDNAVAERGTPTKWAMEAFHLAQNDAYRPLPTPNNGVYALSATYVSAAESAVREQLSRAGVRLAALLNAALP
jgi:transposase InsO family protein